MDGFGTFDGWQNAFAPPREPRNAVIQRMKARRRGTPAEQLTRAFRDVEWSAESRAAAIRARTSGDPVWRAQAWRQQQRDQAWNPAAFVREA
jgi:hypothetical protein